MVRGRSTDESKAHGKSPKVDTSRVDKLIGVWVWEYVLKHTPDANFLRELNDSLPFPQGVPRLKQMAVMKLLSHYIAKDLDIKKILDVLEALHNSVAEPEDVVLSKRFKPSSSHDENPSPDAWRSLEQPTLELKAELRKLLTENKADAEYVTVIKSKLSALLENAWTLFGPLFLERTEAAVMNGSYKPQGISLSLPLPKDTDDSRANEEDVTTNQELDKARQALADSCVELEKLVKDPLPALLSKPGVVKRSLMEPHPSAQAQGWDEEHEEDEIEESPTASASKRIRLPALRRPSETRPLLHSPGTKQRRVVKKWSQEEVDTLKREVQKYGKGRWKMILQKNTDVLQGRTEVDIKDKWRNLEKYNLV